MKKSNSKPTKESETPVFPQTLHRMRPNPDAVAKSAGPASKTKKRPKLFSKSRDVREDRGERQMKTTRNSQSISRGR